MKTDIHKLYNIALDCQNQPYQYHFQYNQYELLIDMCLKPPDPYM